MTGLFVPLDASYDQDPKVLDLDDERSELLFVRALAYCKRHATDGIIHRRALRSIAPCQDEVNPDTLAADLVRTGLWRTVESGWLVAAWLKRNKSTDEFLTADKGRELAHIRHHQNKGIVKPGCPFCEEPQVVADGCDADAMRPCDADADAGLLEPETEPEPEPEPTSPGSENHSDSPAPTPRSDDEIEQESRKALLRLSRIRAAEPGVLNPDAFAATVRKDALANGTMDELRGFIRRGMSADEAVAMYATAEPTAVPSVPAVDSVHPLLIEPPTFCDQCDNGWVDVDGGVKRCACTPGAIGPVELVGGRDGGNR